MHLSQSFYSIPHFPTLMKVLPHFEEGFEHFPVSCKLLDEWMISPYWKTLLEPLSSVSFITKTTHHF